MKRFSILLSMLPLVVTGVMSLARSNGRVLPGNRSEFQSWKRYTVKGEEFSINLPTLPAMATLKIKAGHQERIERMLGAYADGVVYAVYANENKSPRKSLESFIAEQTSDSRLALAFERSLTVNGLVGKEYLTVNQTIVQFFATEHHLYRFETVGAEADDAGVSQFFSSILLGQQREGIEVSDGPGLPFERIVSESSNPDTREKLFTGKGIDKKARLVMKPRPEYTELARKEQITGTVVLKAVFSATGKIVNIRVVSGLPDGLTEQAIAAARKIKFVPAIKDGKFVSLWVQLEYNFNLY